MKLQKFILLGVLIGTLATANAFAEEQAIGFYSKGHLINASTLDWEGDGFVKILRGRNREYATEDLVSILTSAASTLAQEFPNGERLQIADIAQKGGGLVGGHASHQNGLDMDIVYFRMNHREQDPTDMSGLKELFVTQGRLSSNFDLARNWRLIQTFVATARVNRIFMDPVIKASLCKYVNSTGPSTEDLEALRRLRPLVNHQNHMHVRLTCPVESPQCIHQEDVPPGTGCGARIFEDFLESGLDDIE